MERDDGVPFVQYLEKLRDSGDRAAMAVLRRGLGKTPGDNVEMSRYVVPWLPEGVSAWEEELYYLIASLFAHHPDPGGEGTMGTVLSKVARETGSESVEKRFIALLSSHAEDLPERLRHGVSLAKSKSIPINWHRLFRDVSRWGSFHRGVQRTWARDFWKWIPQDEAEAGETEKNQEGDQE